MAIAGEERTNGRERLRAAVVGGTLAVLAIAVVGLLNLAIWAQSGPSDQNSVFREWLRNDSGEDVFVQFDCTGAFDCSADSRFAQQLPPGAARLIVVAPARAFHDRVVDASGRALGCLVVQFRVPNGILPPSALPIQQVSQLPPCPTRSSTSPNG